MSVLLLPQIARRYVVIPDACATHGVPAIHAPPLRVKPPLQEKSQTLPEQIGLAFAGAFPHGVSVGA
jgi:hypothetical protein